MTFEYRFGERVDVLCQLAINEFRGQKSLQLIVQDIRLSSEFEAERNRQKARYAEIMNGANISRDEDIIPTRADVAHVYKFLRYEGMCGRKVLTCRNLRSAILEQTSVDINYIKLKFILNILSDMKVCEFDFYDEEIFEFEVCKNVQKSNIESTDTFKMLESICIS